MEDLSSKPLPLKQRTSSIDHRRDYSNQTWLSLLELIKPREYLITVDNFSIWRRHIAWAFKDGADLRGYMTQRFASNMVFMSLLLGAELNVLFNSDWIATEMRRNMREENMDTISFWVGVIMIVSVFMTILSLFSTFSAWGMVSAVSDENAHCVLRSSIGQYVAELPGRFIVTSFYTFFLWAVLYCFLLLPVGYISCFLVVTVILLFGHVVVVMSSFGRLIMHTGAMGTDPIFSKEFERSLLPHTLHANLLSKAKAQLKTNTSIMRQYRQPLRSLERMTSEKTLTSEIHMQRNSMRQDSSSTIRSSPPNYEQQAKSSTLEPPVKNIKKPTHKRGSSSVRFADDFLSSVKYKEEMDAQLPTPLSMESAGQNARVNRQHEQKPAMNPIGNHRVASDQSIEDWLKGSNSDTPLDYDKETKEPTKFWNDTRAYHRHHIDQKDRFDVIHPQYNDGEDTFIRESAPQPPPAHNNSRGSFRPHPLNIPPPPGPPGPPQDYADARSVASMASSLGGDDDDTFYKEYGFNPDNRRVLPSPAPPAGVKYAEYFSTTVQQEVPDSERQGLLAGDGLQGNDYRTSSKKQNNTSRTEVRRPSLKKKSSIRNTKKWEAQTDEESGNG